MTAQFKWEIYEREPAEGSLVAVEGLRFSVFQIQNEDLLSYANARFVFGSSLFDCDANISEMNLKGALLRGLLFTPKGSLALVAVDLQQRMWGDINASKVSIYACDLRGANISPEQLVALAYIDETTTFPDDNKRSCERIMALRNAPKEPRPPTSPRKPLIDPTANIILG